MNRIEARFRRLAETGEAAFIPYIVAGDPSLEKTAELVLEIERAGADIIEFGVPFSDPVADGPANQEGALRALERGASLRRVIDLVGTLRKQTEVPILLFTYFNPVLAMGLDAFADAAEAAGVDGVLCVDLPIEESEDYEAALRGRDIASVYLIAPTSPDSRLVRITAHCAGFVYCVSRTGVTGERTSVESAVRPLVTRIKAATNLPVAVGFGISTPEHAAEVAGYADGVVVGSAIVRLIGECGDSDTLVPRVGAFVRDLVEATKAASARR